MGNYKFRLSDMIPNAWFYKLRDMTNVRNHNHHRYSATTTKRKHLLPPPNTTTSSDYHYKYNPPANPKALDTHFLEPPKKSSSHPPNGTRTTIRNSIYYKQQSPKTITSSNNSNCICGRRASPQLSSGLETELTRTHDSFAQPPSPVTNILDDADDGDHDYFSCRVSASANDIIIDMNQSFSTKIQNQEDGYGTISELDQLPSVLTRVPVRVAETDSKFVDHHEPSESFLNHRKVKTISVTQKQSTNGVKLRSNTPRVLGGNGGGGRRSVSKKRRNKEKKESIKGTGGCSVAIVKSSLDPQSDFMESMMEMIVETNIRGPNALEELLACYLSLNSAEYHPLIVNAFHHIWLHFPHLHK